MGLPKGTNNGVKGVKGRSGRKSAYQEKADAALLQDMYLKPQNQEEIETKIREGVYSLKDRHLLNGMEGDSKVLNTIFSKVFPDTPVINSVNVNVEELKITIQQNLATFRTHNRGTAVLPESSQTV